MRNVHGAIALKAFVNLLVTVAITTTVAAQERSPADNAAPSGMAALVFDHVTVVDAEHGRRLPDQRMVIVGNRIRALGPARAMSLPAGARVVNARGQYVIPGLWDMHIHPTVWAPTPEATRHQVNAVYRQLVANGITGIRDPGSAIPLDTFRLWKREIAAGRRVGPRLIVTGPSIEQANKDCGRDHHALLCDDIHVYISQPEEARHLVDSLQSAGADMIKIHSVPRPIWFAVAAEARRARIPFGGHFEQGWDSLPKTVDGLVASDSGALFLDHSLWTDVCGLEGDSIANFPRCVAASARLRRNRTWMASGPGGARLPDSVELSALRSLGPAEFPPDRGRPWTPLTAAERRRLPTGGAFALPDSVFQGPACRRARLIYGADLPWVPGPDFPLNYLLSTHLILLRAALCGVPPWWLLRAATLEPARALEATDSLGTVAAGKVADLVLLEGDPLADIWNVTKIAAVVANGRYFDRAALDRLLTEAGQEWLQVDMLQRRRAVERVKAAEGKTP